MSPADTAELGLFLWTETLTFQQDLRLKIRDLFNFDRRRLAINHCFDFDLRRGPDLVFRLDTHSERYAWDDACHIHLPDGKNSQDGRVHEYRSGWEWLHGVDFLFAHECVRKYIQQETLPWQ